MPRRQPPDPHILELVRDEDWDTVAAGPFITIMNDILALVIFFAVAVFLLVPGA